jgi:hypothetical protein
LFSPAEVALVEPAKKRAEELAGDFFHLPRFGPDRYVYEVVTACGLRPQEVVDGVFAHLVRYARVSPGPRQERAPAIFYRICLQDAVILDSLARTEVAFDLEALLLYVLTHELVHVVRIERFEHFYDAAGPEVDCEEALVHDLTHRILGKLPDARIQAVLKRYREHRIPVRR